MSSIDYEAARQLLNELIKSSEQDVLQGTKPEISAKVEAACDLVFASRTQAYREVILGCTVARLFNKGIDIRKPYIDLGPSAFSGRSLDEKAINPFLQEKKIPCSRGPYLSVFRRSIQFTPEIGTGLRDKKGYKAFLSLIAYLEKTDEDCELREILQYLLYRFVELREDANIPLSRLQRISLTQNGTLISRLLEMPSGGLLPLLLVVAMFKTIVAFFDLPWEIAWQGINVADSPSGAGGDITISCGGETILAVEVTERQVDSARLTATFNTKIAPSGIKDYLFLVGATSPTEDATQQARRYFAQGHEVNFAHIKEWILMVLFTTGLRGREMFNSELLELLDHSDVPQTVKAHWNEQIETLLKN